jgi:hypothetical protein
MKFEISDLKFEMAAQPQHDAPEPVEQFLTGAAGGEVRTWFHGMRARIMAMPHVSVIPANIRPAPTKAESPAQ